MLFYTKKINKKNVKLVNSDGKEICKFSNYRYKTSDKKLINILSDNKKYPWIYSVDEEKLKSGEVNAFDLGIGEEALHKNQMLNDFMNNVFEVERPTELINEK